MCALKCSDDGFDSEPGVLHLRLDMLLGGTSVWHWGHHTSHPHHHGSHLWIPSCLRTLSHPKPSFSSFCNIQCSLFMSLIMWRVWKVFENLCAHLKPSLTLFSYIFTVEWDRAGGLFDAHGGFKSLHAWSRDIEGAKTQRFIFESHEWCRHLNLIASTLCIGCIASLFFSFFDLLKCWQCREF